MDSADTERLKTLREALAEARTTLDTIEVGGNLGSEEGIGPLPEISEPSLDGLRDRIAQLEREIETLARGESQGS